METSSGGDKLKTDLGSHEAVFTHHGTTNPDRDKNQGFGEALTLSPRGRLQVCSPKLVSLRSAERMAFVQGTTRLKALPKQAPRWSFPPSGP